MTETFGEMDPDEKTPLTHRADAFRQLVAASVRDTATSPFQLPAGK